MNVLRRLRRDEGSVIPLIIGLFAIVLTLIVVVADLTAVHLARVRLLDASDAAAADAADALRDDAFYAHGGSGGPRLDDAGVRAAARRHLAGRSRPAGVAAWELAPGTGSPDGREAVVAVRAEVELPILTDVLHAFGGTVRVTVESRARARERQP